MTSRDVIVALQRSQSRHGVGFPCARVVELFWALLWFIYLVVALTGCSMDRNGLSSSLRGRIDVDANPTTPEMVPDGGEESDLVAPPKTSFDASVQNDVDSGSGTGPDSQGTTDVKGMGDGANSVEDAGTTPPPCPFDPTRSLSPCNSFTALCRTYDTPGHAVLQENCTAEGYLCVAKCPT